MVETVYQLTVEDTLYVNVLLDSVVCIEVVFLSLTVKKSFRVYILMTNSVLLYGDVVLIIIMVRNI
jgi:hypothetical protein